MTRQLSLIMQSVLINTSILSTQFFALFLLLYGEPPQLWRWSSRP